jgi:glycerol uptake facilitator-like aquaporin
MQGLISLDKIITKLTKQFGGAPDHRIGRNITYAVSTALLVALALFFTNATSMHDFYISYLKIKTSKINILSLFKIIKDKIPTANTVRNILDGLDTAFFNGIFAYLFYQVKFQKDNKGNYVFKFFKNTKYLVAIDGSQYFSSNKIKCPFCCTKTHNKNGNVKIEIC